MALGRPASGPSAIGHHSFRGTRCAAAMRGSKAPPEARAPEKVLSFRMGKRSGLGPKLLFSEQLIGLADPEQPPRQNSAFFAIARGDGPALLSQRGKMITRETRDSSLSARGGIPCPRLRVGSW